MEIHTNIFTQEIVFPCAEGICLGLLCILAIMQQHNVNAFYTMNQTCQYLSEGYIGDPNSCQSWGYCRAGALIQTGVCGDGYLYDAQQGMCNFASSVNCHTANENICANTGASEFVGDPNNCNRYCYCSNNNIVQCNYCPANEVYDPDLTECVFSNTYTCAANSICALVKNNVFVGDPVKCGNFIRCVGGTGQSLPCQSGGFFNPMTVSCQLTSQCINSPNTPSQSIIPASTGICQQYSGVGENFFPVANTCANFWACSDSTGPPTYGTCPFATEFDAALKECVLPVSVKCEYDRCANINLPLVAVPGNQCQSYQVCKNQQAVTGEIYSCAQAYPNSNYKYFDETVQACVATIPKYAVCQGN